MEPIAETIAETMPETIPSIDYVAEIAQNTADIELIMYYILGILLLIFVYGAFRALYRLFDMFF